MKRLFLLTVITTVALTACNNTKNTTDNEKYTITFGQNDYSKISDSADIFITNNANSDFTIEKAEEVESGWVMLPINNGQEIKTNVFSAKKIEGHNRLQIYINGNAKQAERNFILYVKNGEERGKLTFNQEAYDPKMIGNTGTILFNPIYYLVGSDGGVFETATAKEVLYLKCIRERDGKTVHAPEYSEPSFLEAEALLSATVIPIKDDLKPDLIVGAKLKLDVKPNNTGKEREIYVDVEDYTSMRGYVVVLQSAK